MGLRPCTSALPMAMPQMTSSDTVSTEYATRTAPLCRLGQPRSSTSRPTMPKWIR